MPLEARSPKSRERAWLRVHVNRVLRPNPHVVCRLVHQARERRTSEVAVALQHYPGVEARIAGASSAGNNIKEALAVGICGKSGWRPDIPEYADRRGALFNQCDDRLRFQRTVLERVHNGLLHLDNRAPFRPDRARIGNRDIAAIVDGLVWECDEIARSHARLDGNEQAAGGGLKHRNADDISDTKANFGRATSVRKHLGNSGRLALEDFFDLRGNPHEGVRQRLRVKFLAAYVGTR